MIIINLIWKLYHILQTRCLQFTVSIAKFTKIIVSFIAKFSDLCHVDKIHVSNVNIPNNKETKELYRKILSRFRWLQNIKNCEVSWSKLRRENIDENSYLHLLGHIIVCSYTKFGDIDIFCYVRIKYEFEQDLGLQCQTPLSDTKFWCWSLNCM